MLDKMANAKVLGLPCATGDSSFLTVEPDGITQESGLRIALRDEPSDSSVDI